MIIALLFQYAVFSLVLGLFILNTNYVTIIANAKANTIHRDQFQMSIVIHWQVGKITGFTTIIL